MSIHKIFLWIMVSVLVVWMSTCRSEKDVLLPDINSPTIISTDPVNATTGAAIDRRITATFNEDINSSTINSATFLVRHGTTSVLGAVTYSGRTATFTPLANLEPNATYTAAITTGAKDLPGNALASDFVWNFTTGAAADTIAPALISTIPLDAATGVSISDKLTITFSEMMDPLTINTATFSVKGPGGTPVTGTVVYDVSSRSAVFAPADNFAANTVYTAVITTGAKDLAGNAPASNFTWNFTTGSIPDTTAPTVSSTIPVNAATNFDINSKIYTTFSEAMDSLTINSTTFALRKGTTAILGTLAYSGTTAIFTPVGNLEFKSVYTATITTGAKDLAGNALASDFVWTFTTGAAPDTTKPAALSTIPLNAATGVSISSKLTASFSEVMDPLTVTTATFMVTGPGETPVTGIVHYDVSGMSAVFTPAGNLAANTVFTAKITTGARDLAGNALASNFTWNFTTGSIPDYTTPTVSSTYPVNTSTDITVSGKLYATFSEVMDPLTINTTTFTLRKGTTAILGSLTYSGTTAIFTPVGNLEFNAKYTATITTGAKDLAGNALASDIIWTFTTGAAPDTTTPSVISTIPLNAATGVSISSKLTAVFSETMDQSTITTASFTLRGPGETPVPGAVVYDVASKSAVFAPSGNLAANTTFTAMVATGAKDIAGNSPASNYTWNFTTGSIPDTAAPTVNSTYPVNATTNVSITSNFNATFSEVMDPLTINAATFLVRKGTTPVIGSVTYSGKTATFIPVVNLEFNATYTVTVTSGAKDLADNALASNFVWTFNTGTIPDNLLPMVLSTLPVNSATGVSISSKLIAAFSEPMNSATITTATFKLNGPDGTLVTGSVSYDVSSMSAVFAPAGILAANTAFTATITTGAKDLSGNAPASNHTWSFTTGSIPDTTAPTVSSTIPVYASTDFNVSSKIYTTFSEAMDPLTVNATNITLRKGTTAVLGSLTYSGTTAIFTPVGNLEFNSAYTATVTTGVTDLAGNELADNYVWMFTTGAAPDSTKPTVISANPVNSATGVSISSKLTVTFSKTMTSASLNTATFTVIESDGTAVIGTVVYDVPSKSAVFSPAGNLAANAEYTAMITTGATDLVGNTLASNFTWNFTTGSIPDTTAPTVSSTIPENVAAGVDISSKLFTTFSEAMDPLTINATTFSLRRGTTAIIGTLTHSGTTTIFTPVGNLEFNAAYTATITTGAKDLAGNALASNYTWNFTTAAEPDTLKPTVLSTLPVDATIGVSISSKLTATFSESMTPATLNTETFTVNGPGGIAVTGTVSYDISSMSAVFAPAGNLAANTAFTATITTGAKDLAGNTLASNFTWNFTTGSIPDTTTPMVSSTIPVNAATDFNINSKLFATFNEAMDPLTINTTTFTLRKGTSAIIGTLTYSGTTAIFTPVGNLDLNSIYTATITTGAKDLAGNAMASNYLWSFTTGIVPDTTRPKVISTIPANAATGVDIETKITATFSEVMDPSKIVKANFTVSSTTGTVVYDVPSNSAVFTPNNPLTPNKSYTATIKSAVTDLTGNRLASNYVWNFVTADMAGPAPVNLRSANNFAILAGASITSTGLTTVIGNLGLSPGGISSITGFPPGVVVNGSIFTADNPGQVAIVNQAKLDLTTAYNDAVGRSRDVIIVSDGELGGKTLAPGLYISGISSFKITSSNLTLAGGVNDVWIFQMPASTFTVSSGRQVVLSEGAQAKNIYWAVGSSATLGTYSVVNGNILADQSITLQTGARLIGRALTQTAAITLDSNVVTKP